MKITRREAIGGMAGLSMAPLSFEFIPPKKYYPTVVFSGGFGYWSQVLQEGLHLQHRKTILPIVDRVWGRRIFNLAAKGHPGLSPEESPIQLQSHALSVISRSVGNVWLCPHAAERLFWKPEHRLSWQRTQKYFGITKLLWDHYSPGLPFIECSKNGYVYGIIPIKDWFYVGWTEHSIGPRGTANPVTG